jgi:ketosteroid isomerase-like protein
MSRRNVELTRRFVEVWNKRDIDAIIEFCAPDVEFHSMYAAIGGAVYRGHEELRNYQRDLEDAWGGAISMEPEAYFDLGKRTLTFQLVHARGRYSGVEAEMPIAVLCRWREGLIDYLKAYIHREDALRDLGVAEDELEPIAP